MSLAAWCSTRNTRASRHSSGSACPSRSHVRSSSPSLLAKLSSTTHFSWTYIYFACLLFIHFIHVVIIFGIYLLSKHGEEDVGSGSMGSEALTSSRAHLTSGHFGALMPLSPSHRSTSMIASQQSKTYEDKEEQTPLRPEAHGTSTGNGLSNGNGHHHNGFSSPKTNGAVVKSGESPRAYQRIVV